MKIRASAPSNIALVKYWGKKEEQKPLNPSLSFSLEKAKTDVQIEIKKAENFSFEFFFEGKPKPSFHPKLEKFFSKIMGELPFLKEHHLMIETSNTFPHSTGIASSASSFAAMSLALVGLEYLLSSKGAPFNQEIAYTKASSLARLGSGSACRSLFGEFNSWGSISQTFATKVDCHPRFKTLQDYILIVDDGEKSVSSSEGHELMNQHFYRERRIEEANLHFDLLRAALAKGDVESFLEITISEAMSLHALMMTSKPSYLLMKPLSVEILSKLFKFRQSRDIPFTFTLDAGPNIHLIFFREDQPKMEAFLRNEIYPILHEKRVIKDQIGQGAKILWD